MKLIEKLKLRKLDDEWWCPTL